MNTLKLLAIATLFSVVNAFGLHVVNSSEVYDCNMAPDNILIEANGVLMIQNCAIAFGTNQGITIEDGGRLILDNAILTSVTVFHRWKGVEIQDHSNVSPSITEIAIVATNSKIEHARQGVYNSANPLGGITTGKGFSFENCDFKDNNIHFNVQYPDDSYSTALNNPITISKSDFWGTLDHTTQDNSSVYITNGNDVRISDCTFKSISPQKIANGLLLVSCNTIRIERNHFNSQSKASIHIRAKNKSIEIKDNNFEVPEDLGISGIPIGLFPDHICIYINGAPVVSSSNYDWPKTEQITIHNNRFYQDTPNNPYDDIHGIFVRRLHYENMTISNNRFEVLNRGIIANQFVPGCGTMNVTNNNFQIGLNSGGLGLNGLYLYDVHTNAAITCNTFSGSEFGLFIFDPNNLPDDYSNKYINNDVDIQNNTTTPYICNVTNPAYAPVNNVGLVTVLYHDPEKAPFRPCAGIAEKLEKDLSTTPVLTMDENIVTVVNIEEESTITILNALGQVVHKVNASSSEINFDVFNYNSGIYFINIDNKTSHSSLKFIK